MSARFPHLTTTRLRLREIVPADADALLQIHSDTANMRWFGVDTMQSREEAEHLVTVFNGLLADGTGARWGIVRRDDNRLIGTCGFFRWNRGWHSCLIGFELCSAMQRIGYMGEAVAAIVDYGFRHMALHRIQAESHPQNIASINLLTGLGFQFEGVHRQQGFWNGKFHDLNCYSLLKSEWQQRI